MRERHPAAPISAALIGKYQEHAVRDAEEAPDHVLDSVADLPALLARQVGEAG